MNTKVILIIDPQIDFISGSLAVPMAEEKMLALAEYLRSSDHDTVVFTCDWHPMTHISFKENGGVWPRHCVKHTVGAAIFPPLIDAAYSKKRDVYFLTKGDRFDKEEFSIFKNFASKDRLKKIISMAKCEQIDVCGIAMDVCVKDTIKDGMKIFSPSMFNVMLEYTPAITKQGELEFMEMLQENDIKHT